jgi:hypothetical protein
MASQALGATAFVGTLSGRLYRVTPDGNAQVLTTLPGPIAALARSQDGVFFVCVHAPSPRIFQVAPNGDSSEVDVGLPVSACKRVRVSARAP